MSTSAAVVQVGDIGDFMGTQINYATEYHEIRTMMGTKGTDLEQLSYQTVLMYVNAPDKWVEPYQNLINEIDTRKNMLDLIALGLH